MKRFADQGHRVLYVETQVHWVTYLREISRRFARAFSFMRGRRQVSENLWVVTPPLVLPFFQMNRAICRINNALLTLFTKYHMRRLGFAKPIVYNYTPYSSFLVKKLDPARSVYECVDEFAVDKGLVRKAVVEDLENETIEQSDVVIVTARNLQEKKRHPNRYTYLIPNAADIEHYRDVNRDEVKPAEVYNDLPKPVVGFLGALAYWIDIDLIAYLADHLPTYSFVFVGPVSVDIARLRGRDNVHFLGRKPFDELPGYLAGMDVCINPYVLDDIAAGCSPLKLYEYIAAGKPVVSVRMPEAEQFADIVQIADSYEDFARLIENTVAKDHSWKRQLARKSWVEAQNHTWDKRFEQTVSVLEECFDEDRD